MVPARNNRVSSVFDSNRSIHQAQAPTPVFVAPPRIETGLRPWSSALPGVLQAVPVALTPQQLALTSQMLCAWEQQRSAQWHRWPAPTSGPEAIRDREANGGPCGHNSRPAMAPPGRIRVSVPAAATQRQPASACSAARPTDPAERNEARSDVEAGPAEASRRQQLDDEHALMMDEVWDPVVSAVFHRAMIKYPSVGRMKIVVDGKK